MESARTAGRSGGKEQCPNTVITGFMESSEGAPLVVHEALSRRDLAADWFYHKTPASIITDMAQIMTSFVACGLFVAETYTREKPEYAIAGYVISAFCFTDYCWRLYLSENRTRYIFSVFGIIDIVSILPSLLYAATKNNGLAFLRVVRLIQLVRVIHFFRILKNQLYKQVLALLLIMFSLLFSGASLICITEKGDLEHFHTSLYFIIIVTTPNVIRSEIGRVIVMMLILTTLIVVPMQSQEILNLIANQPSEPTPQT
eukprot:m51a1_g1137 putative ion channel family protein (258) ;mRNA; r:242250-243293